MQITVPDLGVDSAEVSEIMVKVGDTIAVDDIIFLLESDKASVEMPSPYAGVVCEILVKLGDKVQQDDALMVIETADATTDKATDSKAGESKPAKPKAEQTTNQSTEQPSEQPKNTENTPKTTGESRFALPDLGVDSAQVSEWLVAVGDTVSENQSIVLVESDKASVEVPAPIGGKIVELLVNAGDTVSNGQDFVVISGEIADNTDNNVSEPTTAPVAQPREPTPTKATEAKTENKTQENQPSVANVANTLTESQANAKLSDAYAGPAVRKITRQLGVDITQVKGSGPNGRIVKEDVFAYVKNRLQNAPTQTAQNVANTGVRSGLPPLPDMSKTDIWGEIETQDLSRLQKVSIPQLNYNTYLPQVTQFDLSDITDTENLRNELKEDMKKQGVSLTILAFIMKATAYALMQFPKFNSHLSDDNSQIIVRKTVNMGFAVATDDGLTVPVIQNVQDKGIKQLAIEIGELAKKARDKKLSAKELQGASFTISSQGNLGGTYFTPLVNWPQVGILGVSESTMQPRWNDKTQSFEPRLMLPLSLSYDHRVINGADAAVFTRYIAKLLQDPRKILL